MTPTKLAATAAPKIIVPPAPSPIKPSLAPDQPLIGDGTWEWLRAFRQARDIKVFDTDATNWGSISDPMDGGTTASGIRTAGHPEVLGVSLPMRGCPQTAGSPIPFCHYKTTMVTVYSYKTGLVKTFPLIDIGPAHYYKGREIKHGIDLTDAAVLALGLSLKDGVYRVDYRIHDVYPAQ